MTEEHREAGPISSDDEAERVRARIAQMESLSPEDRNELVEDLLAADRSRLQSWEERHDE